jgi:hypothetical protein
VGGFHYIGRRNKIKEAELSDLTKGLKRYFLD